ncbi:MAG: DUF2877 domain-containing protein [Eubacteriales bacterium]|nr:DUF2877 domain-containing protein [Eubacteriales bacterium]
MKSTDWAGCFLRQNKRLQVHSVYHRTVNIYAENRILAFHPDSISLTPLSLALPLHEEEFARLANAVREKKEIQMQWTESQEVQIHIGKYRWNVGENEVWNPKITGSLNKEQMRLALQQMREVIMRYSHLGGFSDSVFRNKNPKDDLMSGILREKITLLLDVSVRPGKMEELGRIAQELIGLGVGLTPSGDDFVTGLLLGFLTGTFPFDEEELEDFREMVKRQAMYTNDISRQYLLCACEGEFGENYHQLLRLCKTGQSISKCLEQIIQTGHTSGLDALNGLAAGWMICCFGED